MEFARRMWNVADGVGELRIDTVLIRGVAAIAGTDLSKGLERYSIEQQAAVGYLASDLDSFGNRIRDVVDEYLRTDDRIADHISREVSPWH